MASSMCSVKGSEKVYLALLLICFFYILLSSPIGEHAQSIVRPVWQASSAANLSSTSHLNINDTDSAPDGLSDPAHTHKHQANTTAQAFDRHFGHEEVDVLPPLSEGELDKTRMAQVGPYLRAIMDPKDAGFDRLQCPRPFIDRYRVLYPQQNLAPEYEHRSQKKRYFFALNLYQCAYVLPRLLASIVEAMRRLGPEDCVLSIVGGRSDDGTTEILSALREEIEALEVTYHFGTSDIDPLRNGQDRVTDLARLRNLALAPLFAQHQQWSADATVVFVNDVSICTDDILELVYQKEYQKADMVCAMDWNNDGGTFYDSWIGRSMNGDMFIEVPQSGAFDFAWNLFWNDEDSQYHINEKLPLQVFACWNGAVAFKAEPLLLHNLRFRAAYKGECYTGEPTLFCKDLWALGYGRIAVIPSVNVGYNDDQSRGAKGRHGYASANIQETEHDKELSTEIKWKKSPPALVKCQTDWAHSSWAPWDHALEEHVPFDWTRSGYFNAKKPFSHDLEFEDEFEEEDLGKADAGQVMAGQYAEPHVEVDQVDAGQAAEENVPQADGEGNFYENIPEMEVGEPVYVDELQS